MSDVSTLQAELKAASEREATLKRSYDDLRDFIDNAAIGLHWVGPDGTVLWANQSELELLGYTQDEYVGRHIAEFDADRDVMEDIPARLTRGETPHSYPGRLRCKDGSIRHVLITSDVRLEGDRFVHTRCFTRDATEIKRASDEREEALARERAAREEAEVALRACEEFIAAAAHELKTSVTSLRLAAEMLLKRLDRWQALEPTRVHDVLRTVDEQSAKLSRLVSQLLDVSRLGAGDLALMREPTDLVELTRRPVAAVRRRATHARIELVGPDCLPVVVDPERVEQVVSNLVDNALRYSPSGGRVCVAVAASESTATVSVTDEGIGVPVERRSRLFERFFQAHHSEHYSGMGLSLHISRPIAELHGGSLRAEFPESGGSRASSRSRWLCEPPRAHPGRGRRRHDQAACGRGSYGRGVRGRDGSGWGPALALAVTTRPSLILLDMRMPEMDGWVFADAYRRAPAPHAPMVVCTAAADARRRAAEVGAADYLAKPFSLDARGVTRQ